MQKNLNDENLYNGKGLPIREEDLEIIANITNTLLNSVDPEARTSPLFPKDLNTTSTFLDTVSRWVANSLIFLFRKPKDHVVHMHVPWQAKVINNVWHANFTIFHSVTQNSVFVRSNIHGLSVQ